MIPSRFYFLLLLFSRLLLFFLACSVCAFIFGHIQTHTISFTFCVPQASQRSTLCRGLCRPTPPAFPSCLIVFHCGPRLALRPCPKSAFSPALCVVSFYRTELFGRVELPVDVSISYWPLDILLCRRRRLSVLLHNQTRLKVHTCGFGKVHFHHQHRRTHQRPFPRRATLRPVDACVREFCAFGTSDR